jgi:hypothetical protein
MNHTQSAAGRAGRPRVPTQLSAGQRDGLVIREERETKAADPLRYARREE